MKNILLLSLLISFSQTTGAAFANYNNILFGERAGGMGGAYTALSGDPAACPFYNPASIARMSGSSLSASVNAYHKYDTKFGSVNNFQDASLRVNRGSIVPIPASSGTVYSFGNFALGLSIVFPDFDAYQGEIHSSTDVNSFLNLRDESLWVGGNLALNLSENDSLGITMYYTSRTFNRSVTDRSFDGVNTTITSEEKSFTHNDLLYILGYFHQFNSNWTTGVSYRFASLPISSQGNYFKSVIDTGAGASTPITESDLVADTRIPPRLGLGLAYEEKKHLTIAFDIHHYFPTRYRDLKDSSGWDLIDHRSVTNFSLGGEYYLMSWVALRVGLYTNFSSNKEIPENPRLRQGDYVDMWGYSTNLAVHTSPQTTFTLGGYYTGGKGYSVQQEGQQLLKLPKSNQLFSFLVGTSFNF